MRDPPSMDSYNSNQQIGERLRYRNEYRERRGLDIEVYLGKKYRLIYKDI